VDTRQETIPIVTLTGFLGSGKSTLLNALLQDDRMPPSAIIVNELGEIPIDHALLEHVTEGIALLPSGCVCCAVRTDLEYTLRDLYIKRVRGLIPDFQAVLLETTGMADPGPVLQTLSSHAVREQRYRLGPVITTVDCTYARQAIADYSEARQQIAIADRLILTKSDLSTAEERHATQQRIAEINPLAPCISVIKGQAVPAMVLGKDFPSHSYTAAPASPWANAVASHALHGRGARDSAIQAYCYVVAAPLDWNRVSGALKELLGLYGDRLLRIKGLLQIVDVEAPVILQAVHHSLYPPEVLPAWPAGDRDSRLVIIADGVERTAIDAFIASLTKN
jgi:G3E family GTPase